MAVNLTRIQRGKLSVALRVGRTNAFIFARPLKDCFGVRVRVRNCQSIWNSFVKPATRVPNFVPWTPLYMSEIDQRSCLLIAESIAEIAHDAQFAFCEGAIFKSTLCYNCLAHIVDYFLRNYVDRQPRNQFRADPTPAKFRRAQGLISMLCNQDPKRVVLIHESDQSQKDKTI